MSIFLFPHKFLQALFSIATGKRFQTWNSLQICFNRPVRLKWKEYTSRPYAEFPMIWNMDIRNIAEVGGDALVVWFDETCRLRWEWSAYCSMWRGVWRALSVGLPGLMRPGGMLCRCPKSRAILDVYANEFLGVSWCILRFSIVLITSCGHGGLVVIFWAYPLLTVAQLPYQFSLVPSVEYE